MVYTYQSNLLESRGVNICQYFLNFAKYLRGIISESSKEKIQMMSQIWLIGHISSAPSLLYNPVPYSSITSLLKLPFPRLLSITGFQSPIPTFPPTGRSLVARENPLQLFKKAFIVVGRRKTNCSIKCQRRYH